MTASGRTTLAAEPMDREAVLEGFRSIVDRYGPWATHNVALPHGLFTLGPEPRGDNYRVVKFLQLAADLLAKPLSELRVLDLGCGEGLYAIEFAQHGCQVIGIEGRQQHFEKAEFARQSLGLETVRFVHGDVREISVERYGVFDLVLCSGILYHLDHPAAFELLRSIKLMCRGSCFVDTRIALEPAVEVEWGGSSYYGAWYREHAPGASEAERLAEPGASLDNEQSFWFTRTSLANLLAELGFTSVVECWAPVPLVLREDRVTLVATAGERIKARNEIGDALADRRWPRLGATGS